MVRAYFSPYRSDHLVGTTVRGGGQKLSFPRKDGELFASLEASKSRSLQNSDEAVDQALDASAATRSRKVQPGVDAQGSSGSGPETLRACGVTGTDCFSGLVQPAGSRGKAAQAHSFLQRALSLWTAGQGILLQIAAGCGHACLRMFLVNEISVTCLRFK